MFEPISKNQILGSHSLEKVQTTCKSRVTLKQHKYYTTKLGRQKYLLDMELRCPILKFPQKNWTKHDVFFLRLAPQEAFLPFLTFLRCFKPHQDLLSTKKTAPTKTYTKHPTLQKYLRKNLMKKTLNPNYPIHIDLMFQTAKRDFFVHFVSMYWSCWSTSICKSLESFSLIDPGWSISALNFGEGTCTESSIDIGIRKQRLISDVTQYFTWNWCSKTGLETCRLKQTLRYNLYLKSI